MNAANKLTTILSAEEMDGAQAAAWSPPVVHGPRANRRDRPTLGELEDIEKIAWDEGYEKGHAAGLAAAEQEIRQRIDALDQRGRQFDAVMHTLSEPLQQLDDEIEKQLVSLTIAIARHVIRRELRTDPGQIIAVVRESIGLLPLAQRNIRVHLHPLDASVVRELLAQPQTDTAWTIIEDPVMARGGCRISTDTSQIDARLETRLATVLKHLLNDERDSDGRNEIATDDGSTEVNI